MGLISQRQRQAWGWGAGAKGERQSSSDNNGVRCAVAPYHRKRRLSSDHINRRGVQMMEDLADLAAVLVVGRLRRDGRFFDDRNRQAAGDGQIVVMPAEQDRLEQHREDAEPREAQEPRAGPFMEQFYWPDEMS